jgi:hypothetical protein
MSAAPDARKVRSDHGQTETGTPRYRVLHQEGYEWSLVATRTRPYSSSSAGPGRDRVVGVPDDPQGQTAAIGRANG